VDDVRTSSRPSRRQILVGLLSGGSLAFGILALVRPQKVAPLVGGSTAVAQALGARDVGAGLALAISPGARGPLIARLVFDLHDGITLGREQPKVAAMAYGFAALGVAALLSR
jgi:hypothetical protein